MTKCALLVTCILILSSEGAQAQKADLTGDWTSEYQFGPIKESMTANIKQIGSNLIGSYIVKPSEGAEYSGIIFGAVDGCLLYTSDAADDLLCVDLGGRRIIKKKNTHTQQPL